MANLPLDKLYSKTMSLPPSKEREILNADPDLVEYLGTRKYERNKLTNQAIALKGDSLSPYEESMVEETLGATHPLAEEYRGAENKFLVDQYVPETGQWIPEVVSSFMHAGAKNFFTALKGLPTALNYHHAPFDSQALLTGKPSVVKPTPDEGFVATWADWMDNARGFLSPTPLTDLQDPNAFLTPSYRRPPNFFSAYNLAGILGGALQTFTQMFAGAGLLRLGGAAPATTRMQGFLATVPGSLPGIAGGAYEAGEQMEVDLLDQGYSAEYAAKVRAIGEGVFFGLGLATNAAGAEAGLIVKGTLGRKASKSVLEHFLVAGGQEARESALEVTGQEVYKTVTGVNKILNWDDSSLIPRLSSFHPIENSSYSPYTEALTTMWQGTTAGAIGGGAIGGAVSYGNGRAMKQVAYQRQYGQNYDSPDARMMIRLGAEFGLSLEEARDQAAVIDGVMEGRSKALGVSKEDFYEMTWAMGNEKFDHRSDVVFASLEDLKMLKNDVLEKLGSPEFQEAMGSVALKGEAVTEWLRDAGVSKQALYWSGLQSLFEESPDDVQDLGNLMRHVNYASLQLLLHTETGYSEADLEGVRKEIDRSYEQDKYLTKELNRAEQKEDVEGAKKLREQIAETRVQQSALADLLMSKARVPGGGDNYFYIPEWVKALPQGYASKKPEAWVVSVPEYLLVDPADVDTDSALLDAIPGKPKAGKTALKPGSGIVNMLIDQTEMTREDGSKGSVLRMTQLWSKYDLDATRDKERRGAKKEGTPKGGVPLVEEEGDKGRVAPWRVFGYKILLAEAARRGAPGVGSLTMAQAAASNMGLTEAQATDLLGRQKAMLAKPLEEGAEPSPARAEAEKALANLQALDGENLEAFRLALKDFGIDIRTVGKLSVPLMNKPDEANPYLASLEPFYGQSIQEIQGELHVVDSQGNSMEVIPRSARVSKQLYINDLNRHVDEMRADLVKGTQDSPMWGFEITPEHRRTILSSAARMFAKVGGQKIASTSFLDSGKALVEVLSKEKANAQTLWHELGHVFEKMMGQREKAEFEKLLGFTVWDTKAREKFANFMLVAFSNARRLNVPANLREYAKKVRGMLGDVYKSGLEGMTRMPQSLELMNLVEDMFFAEAPESLVKIRHEEAAITAELKESEKDLELEKLQPEREEQKQQLTIEVAELKKELKAVEKRKDNFFKASYSETPRTYQEVLYEASLRNEELKEALAPGQKVKEQLLVGRAATQLSGFFVKYTNKVKSAAGRYMVKVGNQIWTREIRTWIGRFDKAVQIFGEPGKAVRKFFKTPMDDYGGTTLDYHMEGEQVDNSLLSPEQQNAMTQWTSLARDVLSIAGAEAEQYSMWRTVKNGDKVPSRETERFFMPRFATPFGRQIMLDGGPRWGQYKAQILEHPKNKGLTDKDLELWRKDHSKSGFFKAEGFLEKSRGIVFLPSQLLMPGDNPKSMLYNDPVELLGAIMRHSAVRTTIVKHFGGNAVKNVKGLIDGGKTGFGMSRILKAFGINRAKSIGELQEDIRYTLPQLDVGKMDLKELRKQATALGLDTNRTDPQMIDLFKHLGPDAASRAGLKPKQLQVFLRKVGNRIGGVDTSKNRDPWALLADIKNRYERGYLDNIMEHLRTEAIAQLEDVKVVDTLIGLIHGEPYIAIESSPAVRVMEAVNSIGSLVLMSASAPLNLASGAIVAGLLGIRSTAKAFNAVLENLDEVDTTLREINALRQLNLTHAGDAGHGSVRLARTAEDVAGRWLGLNTVNDFVDLLTGKAAMIRFEGFLQKGIHKGKHRVLAKLMGLTDEDIKLINQKKGTLDMKAQFVNKAIQRVNASGLSGLDKSQLELDPRFKILRGLKSYSINMTRNIWDLGKVVKESIASKDPGALGGSLYVMGALAAGLIGSGIITDYLKKKRAGKAYMMENEDYVNRALWALMETGALFPLDSIATSLKYSESPEDTFVNQAPTLGLISDLVRGLKVLTQDAVGAAEGKPIPWGARTRETVESVAVGRMFLRQFDRTFLPERAEYYDVKEEIIAWRKKQPDWKSQAAPRERKSDPIFEEIYQALIDGDPMGLDEARVILFRQWINQNDPMMLESKRIMDRLNDRRPLNLNLEDTLAYRDSVSPELWERTLERNSQYLRDMDMIAPAVFGRDPAPGQDEE